MNKTLISLFVCFGLSVVICQTDEIEPAAVNCLRRLEVEVMQCTEEAEHKWKFGDDKALNKEAWCCRNWWSSQCALQPVFQKCNETEVREVLVWLVDQIGIMNNEECKDTPFNTTKCQIEY